MNLFCSVSRNLENIVSHFEKGVVSLHSNFVNWEVSVFSKISSGMSEGGLRRVLDAFLRVIPGRVDEYAKGTFPVEFPLVPGNVVETICYEAIQAFRREPNVLQLSGHIIVVGDLHGHVLDLYRILIAMGLPGPRTFLFLGDLVDRGEFSIETVLIVLLLKVLWPDNVYIIRGNHEFGMVCATGGFREQVLEMYSNEEIYDRLVATFDFLPLAAIVDRRILCVHGGFGPEFRSLDQIRNLVRPIHEFDDDLLAGLLWSDPRDECPTFEPSLRGIGWYFGSNAVKQILPRINMKMLIRAHECVANGYETRFDGLCGTVFSASNYCGTCENKAAVLRIHTGEVCSVRFRALSYLKRSQVTFAPLDPVKKKLKKKRAEVTSRRKAHDRTPRENARAHANS
jgi:protein phosphatase